MCKDLVSRRTVLGSVAAGMGALALPNAYATDAANDARLVLVFLRGAVDGVSVFVPHADADYHAIRPNIGIPKPDGTAQTALALDGSFGMHPAMAALLPEWQAGTLAFVPAAGLARPNRSHFDAQLQMELSGASKTQGWLNSLSMQPGVQAQALGVGEANPQILAGSAGVKLIPRGQAAARTGVLANDKTRSALLDMYAQQGSMGDAFAKGAGSRMQSASELTADRNARLAAASAAQPGMAPAMAAGMQGGGMQGGPSGQRDFAREMTAASNGAADPVGLALDAQHLATLMRNDPKLRLGFLSAGGWDTHANQGGVAGQLAGNLSNLAQGLVSLRKQFNRPNDTIVVMSEFGRTAAENGTRGTDHGFGNALWLIGQRVNGGKWHGEWSGMAKGNLNEARDLPAHHDYRAVLAQILKRQFALSDTQLQTVLPGATWDARMDALLRA